MSMKLLLLSVCIFCSLQGGHSTSSSAGCAIPGETLDTLLDITAGLDRRVIKERNRYEASIVRLRRRACMALRSRRTPFVFVRIIKRSRVLLAQLRRRQRIIYLRRRRCALYAARFRIVRILIGRHRAALLRAVKRERSKRRHLQHMLRRQRQLRSRQSKKACRFRLARLTKRIRRERLAIKKLRSFMVRSQNRLVQSRQRLLKASRSIMAIKCRKLRKVGGTLSRRYRQQIFRMRRILRRVYRRWRISRRHFVKAMRLVAGATMCVRWCYRTLRRSVRRLRRRRRLLCENGHRKFCLLPDVRLRPPTILKRSLAGKCGVAVARVKPRKNLRAKKVIQVKPRN